MVAYEAQNKGFERPHHSFVQLTCTENAIALSVGIGRRVRLKSKKNIHKMNQIMEKVLSTNYNINNYEINLKKLQFE